LETRKRYDLHDLLAEENGDEDDDCGTSTDWVLGSMWNFSVTFDGTDWCTPVTKKSKSVFQILSENAYTKYIISEYYCATTIVHIVPIGCFSSKRLTRYNNNVIKGITEKAKTRRVANKTFSQCCRTTPIGLIQFARRVLKSALNEFEW